MSVIIPGNRSRMSPAAYAAGLSAFRCDYCENRLSLKTEKELIAQYSARCEHCSSFMGADSVLVDVLPRYAHMLRKDTLLGQEWFHATTRKDWVQDLMKSHSEMEDAPVIHIGSMESACELASHKWTKRIKGVKSEVWTIHRLRLKSGYTIAGKVFSDENYWPDTVSDFRQFLGFDSITRYVNRYEIPGSISLLLDYRAVEVIESRRLTLAEVRSTLRESKQR